MRQGYSIKKWIHLPIVYGLLSSGPVITLYGASSTLRPNNIDFGFVFNLNIYFINDFIFSIEDECVVASLNVRKRKGNNNLRGSHIPIVIIYTSIYLFIIWYWLCVVLSFSD